MTTEEKMTIDERRKYLRRMKTRYVKADLKERSRLLDEMEAVVGLHRKSLIRLMNGSLERKPRSKEREETYKADVTHAVRVIAESLDYPCGKRLQPNLVWMAKHLQAHGELELSECLLEKLAQISISTVERRLARIRQDHPRLPRRRTKCVNQLRREIPMRRIPWDVQEPGHFEVDLVHHCGPSASGKYVHTLQMVDVAIGWSECRAILGRSYLVMQNAFCYILGRLPLEVYELHPDNGSEFLNYHLIRFWKEKVKGAQISRSRPYHKNDNPFVEQRNANPVRAYLGYDRLDTAEQTRMVNQLYDKMWLYHNFFQPVMRVKEKTYISEEGQRTRVRRRYDQATTPFDRLCATDVLTGEQRQQLTALRDQTNPRQLLTEIRDLIDYIFSLPGAAPGETEDVYLTLQQPDEEHTA